MPPTIQGRALGAGSLLLLAVVVIGCHTTPAPRPATGPATGPVFGVVREGKQTLPIAWLPTNGVVVTQDSLSFVAAGTEIHSAPLPLRAGYLYDVAATIRRGPGSQIQFRLVYVDGNGRQQQWDPVWQFPDAARPNWVPLAPRRQRYAQGFVLPPDAQAAHLELRMNPPARPQFAPYNAWELTQLEFTEAQPVALGRLGPNRLTGGDMETAGADGLPLGWSQNDQPGAGNVAVVAANDAPSGRQVLRVRGGAHALLVAPFVPVERGTAWRLSLRVRGRGQLTMMAHGVNDEPVPLRVGDPQVRTHVVDAPTWKPIEQLWFAEDPGIRATQILIGVIAQSDVDLDTVEMRPYQN